MNPPFDPRPHTDPAAETNTNVEAAAMARVPRARAGELREHRQDRALASALRKQAAGVPTYTVHEAAALLSISAEHLYRLIRADAFPALRMRSGTEHGRYIIPAQAVRHLLAEASECDGSVEVGELAAGSRITPARRNLP